MKTKKIINNTIMLMIFQITKIVFPFITLPYLTRILTTDTYGTVAYVKTVMNYLQIFVDFGFVLSATKDIVKIRTNKKKMEYVIGDTLIARVILGVIGLFIILILCATLPILKENILYTLLSYIVVFESIFLFDYLFRGIEKMHVITIRFIIMKLISTIFTFILIKSDADLLMIPLLDILSSGVAILLVIYEIRKMNIKMRFSSLKKSLVSIKESFVYFLSNAATTSFNALSTIIIGIYVGATEVASWSVCMQVIGTITACYSPISDGIYPEMIKSKDLNLIKKVIVVLLPVVTVGCIMAYVLARPGLLILGGKKYLAAVPIFQYLIPVLFFSFLSVILGWPALGAIGKEKETTISTIVSIVLHIVLLFILIISDHFTLINVAIVRSVTEFVMFAIRLFFIQKNKKCFKNTKERRLRKA